MNQRPLPIRSSRASRHEHALTPVAMFAQEAVFTAQAIEASPLIGATIVARHLGAFCGKNLGPP